MKFKFSLLLLSLPVLFVAAGCGSEAAKATAEEKKSFAGGPPPANYMDQVNAGANAARDKNKGQNPAAGK